MKGKLLIPNSRVTGRIILRPGPNMKLWQQSHRTRLKTKVDYISYVESFTLNGKQCEFFLKNVILESMFTHKFRNNN